MSNQITKANDLRQLINGETMRKQFLAALPKHLSADRFCRIACTAITKTPKLADCTQESLMACLLSLSAFGLEPDGRRAHLIPYGNQCTLVVDYKGLAELAMRSGVVSNLHADIVCENDEFEYDLGEVKKHRVDFRKPRGEMFAAYAVCRFKDGTVKADCMNKDEIDAIRKRSRSGSNGPWVSDYNEMAKKTVFRRLSKWLPLSAEFRDATEKDDDETEFRDVTPPAPAAPLFPPVQAEPTLLEVTATPLLVQVRDWMAKSGVPEARVLAWLNDQGEDLQSLEQAEQAVLSSVINSRSIIEKEVQA